MRTADTVAEEDKSHPSIPVAPPIISVDQFKTLQVTLILILIFENLSVINNCCFYIIIIIYLYLLLYFN